MDFLQNSPIEDAEDCEIISHLMINVIQKMAIYTNRNRIYLVGANPSQTKFKVLKFERDDPYELIVHDDKVEYDRQGIWDLLIRVNGGKGINNKANRKLGSSELVKEFSTFGIFGVIRFLEGYYLIFITKRSKVAAIGQHSIYKIEETKSYYIPHVSVRKAHSEELKYNKLFHHVDLSSDFYFSYSYDLTNSLQYNNAPFYDPSINKSDTALRQSFMAPIYDNANSWSPNSKPIKHVGVKWKPNNKFVWNKYLLQPLEERVESCWILPVIHGFISQETITCSKANYSLTLMARRSNKYAGTRFLKRGANFEGDVANEVETEQIVHDPNVSVTYKGRFSSFVQMRGSIPCHWSQNTEKNKLPKPPITIDVSDPYAETAGKHFNQLLRRFGSPIIGVNLVKRRERKPHESILGLEYERIVNQLNHTLPPAHKIQLISFDMARTNKNAGENVMQRLLDIAYKTVKKTGIYFSKPPHHMHHLNPDDNFAELERTSVFGDKKYGNWKEHPLLSNRGRYQTGIVRVNCVDCLDRTNTAQFVLGKCALAFQLYWFGELPSPAMNLDLRLLERMYEDHGDVLALQYGGSQLVHRIATYRKTAPLASQGNDMKQSMTRYLANTFSDSEKQQGINLFLGVYVPLLLHHKTALWDLQSDQYLHQSYPNGLPCHRQSTAQWWDDEVMDILPLPCDLVKKTLVVCEEIADLHDDRIDLYADLHRPVDYKSSMSDTDPHCVNERVKYDKEIVKRLNKERNIPSASSSRSSSPETEGTEDENHDWTSLSELEISMESGRSSSPLNFEYYFPDSSLTYGTIINPVDGRSLKMYKEYSKVARAVSTNDFSSGGFIDDDIIFEPLGNYKDDSTYEIKEPTVPEESIKIYRDYIASRRGPKPPNKHDLLQYIC